MTHREFWFAVRFGIAWFLSKINWGLVIFLAILIWFTIPNFTPKGIKCRELGGKPDIDFSCRKISVEIIEVK